jgi:DNA-directed RNA polymerase subunit K/omega
MNSNIKNTNAPISTTTINKNKVDSPTGNIYEAISIVSKRSNQINVEMKKELLEKLDEFATYNENLDEVFENKEQIEVSKYYERLPKPHSIAMEEWLDDKIYYRHTKENTED